jgi:homocysteine S-methyltransferase
MKRDFLAILAEQVVVFDGAMGTRLYELGVFLNRCFDELNVSNGALVESVHRSYVNAGADVIETNTFGANRLKLDRHGLGDQVRAINQAGATLARTAAGELFVAGAMGPLGVRIEPWGPTSVDEAVEIFAEQAAALSEGGVDLFSVETFYDLAEIEAAVRGIRSVSDGPIVAHMTLEDDGSSLEGVAPEVFGPRLAALSVQAVGVNCSVGPAAMLENWRAKDVEIFEFVWQNRRVMQLLLGFRGKPAGDLAALVQTVLACTRYAAANLERLAELDLNPVIVRPQGRGAVAVDALIRLREEH